MQSFRTEIENSVVEQDILDLERKIRLFKEGRLEEEKFRSLRLARGVYGQRQEGVQMIRIKIPFGKLTTAQLRRISDVSDEFSNGRLHITTRQDIQIHYVSLSDTPRLWSELERSCVTLREACGNTVRNITASATAGVDPEEVFDVSPYADAFFRYFLRNPVGQELGRKIKISFSASSKDDVYSFIHDIGFIAKEQNGRIGFKVLIGGGLGAQPSLAEVAYDFLPADEIIPFAESLIRVFDRYGERSKRFKARLKFLLKDIGLSELLLNVESVRAALPYKIYKIDASVWNNGGPKSKTDFRAVDIDFSEFQLWKSTNVFEQKQKGYFGVYGKVQLGNFNTSIARELADLVDEVAADDIRLTIGQNFLLRFVREDALPVIYEKFKQWGFSEPGHGSIADITSCPGTDTCNLGISNSTSISKELEKVINTEYKELLKNDDIKIKISGCMNSCGQHGLATIGFHGSSLKYEGKVLPALQLLLGGGNLSDGKGRAAQKVIKIPSKRGPNALRWLLEEYALKGQEGEYFNAFFERLGKDHFYQLLKPLANLQSLKPEEYLDWGATSDYATMVGVGECAGVVVDLVATLLLEAEEKLGWASQAKHSGKYSDAIYHTYSALISGAKALLLKAEVKTNSHIKIIKDFDATFVKTGKVQLDGTFETFALAIDSNQPTESFATEYFSKSAQFFEQLNALK